MNYTFNFFSFSIRISNVVNTTFRVALLGDFILIANPLFYVTIRKR